MWLLTGLHQEPLDPCAPGPDQPQTRGDFNLGQVPHSLNHHILSTYYVPGPQKGSGVSMVSKPGPCGAFCLVDDRTSQLDALITECNK